MTFFHLASSSQQQEPFLLLLDLQLEKPGLLLCLGVLGLAVLNPHLVPQPDGSGAPLSTLGHPRLGLESTPGLPLWAKGVQRVPALPACLSLPRSPGAMEKKVGLDEKGTGPEAERSRVGGMGLPGGQWMRAWELPWFAPTRYPSTPEDDP